MKPFRYLRAENAAHAIATKEHDTGARFIAGGTNLLDLMKLTVETPELLIDVNPLGMNAIERRGERLHIGALARMREIATHAAVRDGYPMLAIALEESASPQLRTMASIGGNILQRTRCPYFRDTATPCNKRIPGSGCSAIGGACATEAVLGTSDACIATHASDAAVALAACDAIVHVTGANGDREIPFQALYRLPAERPDLETTLEPDELITGISLPPLPFAARSTYVKVRNRAQYEFALVSAAVALDIVDSTIRDARVALGGVATMPWRAHEAERILTGASVGRETFERAADAALVGARSHGGNAFKIPLARKTVIRALEIVMEMA